MTRKRFIKLLMSKGYSRNEAHDIAEIMNKDKIPYKKAIKLCRKNIFFASAYSAFLDLSSIVKTAEKAIKQLALSLKKEGGEE